MLLEDACIGRSVETVLSLFDETAVLVPDGNGRPARGIEEIARAAATMLGQRPTYVANPHQVIQSRDIALSLGGGINVVRRGADGAWRFVIAMLHRDRPTRAGGRDD